MPIKIFTAVVTATLLFSPLTFAQEAGGLNSFWKSRPGFLSLEAEQQSRMQFLDGQFRAGLKGSDQALELRTTLKATMQFDKVALVTELADNAGATGRSGNPPGRYHCGSSGYTAA